MKKDRTYSRRRFMRALGLGAGGWMVHPLLRQLVTTATGQAAPGKRFVVFAQQGGVPVERRAQRGASGIEFTPQWSPLEPFRDDLVVVENAYSPFSMHLHGNKNPLTGVEGIGDRAVVHEPGGITIDRQIAQQLGMDSAFSSISVTPWKIDNELSSQSADGARTPFPSLDPITLFSRLFGDGMTGMDDSARLEALRRNQSVLDGMQADIARMESRLSGRERERMQLYLHSVRELEAQLMAVEARQGSCVRPPTPTEETLGNGRNQDAEEGEVRPERMVFTTELMALSLVCDFTRVAIYVAPQLSMPWLPRRVDTEDGETEETFAGQHRFFHGASTDEMWEAWSQQNAEQLATIWSTLKAASGTEDGRSLADETTMVWLNTNGGVHHNGQWDYWFMVFNTEVGGDRVVTLPTSVADRDGGDPRYDLAPEDAKPSRRQEVAEVSTNDVFVTLSHLCDAPLETFGDPRTNNGPIDELLSA
ncbi:MAG: DUF1552 domain-containing protein [Myxococcota bacterium]